VLARAAAVLLARRRDAFQVQTLRLRKKCSAPCDVTDDVPDDDSFFIDHDERPIFPDVEAIRD